VFSGRRVARGLYKASNGRLINADLNGAYNILRKAVLNAFADGIEGLGVTRIRFTPGKVTL
ncbi:transposase, partial [Anabaenopsis tanganyikae CS-531]|nr:transposase [Anabaenopsis tanganyikae CS-531]